MSRLTAVFFHALGCFGLLLLAVFIYLNEFASDDNILHTYRLKMVLAFVVVLIIHGGYLASDAARRNKYVWLVLLIVAPLPVYWIYYLYFLVVLRRSDSSNESSSVGA
ncbi:hypothetical protein RE428_03970 [Marinobacter nanhaiticus D15-8W]|uniref:Uncharacterized protein n=1 Tax=Marinobacter nanhaiticus D15-8W TaxID=626887 RepID=N6VXD9_9GAMM|nr:hypothetical protein [Marinobacter nanhaiticus]ENO14925.2 hypothetical protein J057_06231 [Marinobacter nanhaiticus D15-8W]BES69379.1 hypothetical protein RE428_03970 [Marinobacter nanhaiticus D15-8W]